VTFEEDKPELTDLEFVAVAQGHPVDTLLVDVGAVQRTCVGHDVTVWRSFDLGVATRHRDVVEADLGLGMATESCGRPSEREPGACLRPRPHDQHTDFVRQLSNRNDDVVLGAWGVLERIDRREGDGSVVE